MKWYTAIGVKNDRADGRFSVRSAAEEKILTGMEIQIWSALLWAFCEEKDIYGRLKGLLRIAFGEEEAQKKADEGEFWYCLRRLEVRGLIASWEGETVQDAAEGMMRRVTMVRAKYTRAEQWRFFLNSLMMGKGLRFSMRAFRKAQLTEKEEGLLHRLEADGRIASHLKELEDKAKQVAVLVDGGDTKFPQSVQREFLADVIALYGRKQLMIESIRKEEYFDASEGCA
ncbi:hypothetical protein [Ruminococcus sp. 5_1_39BFAA]|uniref:hypothetical protein n=1 Tax=Ruminococcus sp. 5_1_39BFAA TaxID=457412 RepID=UPI003561D95E